METVAQITVHRTDTGQYTATLTDGPKTSALSLQYDTPHDAAYSAALQFRQTLDGPIRRGPRPIVERQERVSF